MMLSREQKDCVSATTHGLVRTKPRRPTAQSANPWRAARASLVHYDDLWAYLDLTGFLRTAAHSTLLMMKRVPGGRRHRAPAPVPRGMGAPLSAHDFHEQDGGVGT